MQAEAGADPFTCRRCGAKSVLARHFVRRRCPPCQPRVCSTAESLGAIGLGVGLAAVVVGGELAWGWELPRVDLFLLALAPLAAIWCTTVLHEGAHALAARTLGWRVLEVRIGAGKPLLAFQLGRTRLSVGHPLGWGGQCRTDYGAGTATRGGLALVHGAPLVVHAAVAAAVWPWVRADYTPGFLAACLFAANLWALFWSAVPQAVRVKGAFATTDGRKQEALAELEKLNAVPRPWPACRRRADEAAYAVPESPGSATGTGSPRTPTPSGDDR